MLATGRASLDDGRLDDAETSIQRTRSYRPEHPGIEPNLGRVDLARADTHAANGLPGAALLAFRHAQRHLAGHPGTDADTADQGIRQATQTLRERQQVTLHLAIEAGAPPTFGERLRDRLLAHRGAALDLGPGGETVTVRPGSMDFPPVRVTTEKKTHRYEVTEYIPNPLIPELQHRLAASGRDLDRLSSRASGLRSDIACLKDDDGRRHLLKNQLGGVERKLSRSRRDQSSLRNELSYAPATIPKTRTERLPYCCCTTSETPRGQSGLRWRTTHKQASPPATRRTTRQSRAHDPSWACIRVRPACEAIRRSRRS